MNRFRSLDDAYIWLIPAILQYGEHVSPRSLPTVELRAVSIGIEDPRRRYVSIAARHWSFAYAIGEFCWHARGSNDLEEIAFYASKWRSMSEDGVKVLGSCYGRKIFRATAGSMSQWQGAKKILTTDPGSRRAILNFGSMSDVISSERRDVTCATGLQFFVRQDRLEAAATMRSNDAILGLPYDVFFFTMLQEMMATELRLQVGPYYHFAGSVHIYERQLGWANEIATSRPTVSEPMPAMPGTMGMSALLDGEVRTRSLTDFDLSMNTSSGYWEHLLEVLNFCNGRRLSNSLDIDSVIELPLYRRLVQLHAP